MIVFQKKETRNYKIDDARKTLKNQARSAT